MASSKAFKVGLLISGSLIMIILVGTLVVGISSYEGHCISFEPPERPCTLLEFLFPYLLLWIVFSIVEKPILTFLVLDFILAPTIIGYLLGRKESQGELFN